MKLVKRTGLGLLAGVLMTGLVGVAKPAAADVEFYFGTAPPVYVVPAPPPATWYQWGPGYYYHDQYRDRGYYYPGWRHDGYRWRYEQGYWGR